MRQLKSIVTLIFLSLLIGACSDDDQLPKAIKPSIEEEILRLVNEHRSGLGLNELSSNQVIINEARKHSQAMSSGTVSFGHDGFDDRISVIKSEITGNGFAENVATGYTDAAKAVNGWLNSSGHKKNIEGNYNLTGIGVAASNDGTLFFTQIFMHN
ncbi:CAP domain-containing protein [Fulvivirgaceae bacterium BMA12]|uniref:CAP domain-containing protein n=1 Tax=Agaribacillus aureus TaxID=3051825 RepID=A0ABT8L6J9_9BACT|nr:CAP domain-containing protein [Fulvivirgaceae bacterium BMA12]